MTVFFWLRRANEAHSPKQGSRVLEELESECVCVCVCVYSACMAVCITSQGSPGLRERDIQRQRQSSALLSRMALATTPNRSHFREGCGGGACKLDLNDRKASVGTKKRGSALKMYWRPPQASNLCHLTL